MALDKKYGKLDIPGIGDDEPVFILRARDKAAAPAIHDYARYAYADVAHDNEVPNAQQQRFTESVVERATEFETWAEEHPDEMKVPD